MLHWPVSPVSATADRTLPEQGAAPLAYEMKWDGFRAVVWRLKDGVRIQSRQGVDLTRFLPDVVDPLVKTLPAKAVVDGEVIAWDDEQGRCDFSRLQRRLIAGRALPEVVRQRPAHFVAFDLLRDGRGVELVDQPFAVRRAKLERLLAGAPLQVALCPQTENRDVARGWLTELAVAGIEGVVAKPLTGLYLAGRAGWTKVRARSTAEYVIGGVTGSLGQPNSLLLGRFDHRGVLRYAGQTHPIKAAQRSELTAVLRGMPFMGDGAGHPWPCPLPAGWSAGMASPRPLPFTPVEPTIVAEVEVDTALDGPFGRIRHRGLHLRTRLDLRPQDVARAGQAG